MRMPIQSILLVCGLLPIKVFAEAPVQNTPEQKPPVERPEVELPETLPTQPQACTQEAKLLCISYGPKLYQAVGVGRLGPNCEFPELPFEVEAENCADAPPPSKPIICTLDARVACVITEARTYESVELGRLGPNCHFPILASEVDDEFCTKGGVDQEPDQLQ